MGRFRLSPLAKSDLAGIRHYIAKDKPVAADRQIATFREVFRMLARSPELGESQPDWGADLRSFVTGNYVIVYRSTRGGGEIARVVSGYRNLSALF